MSKILYIIPLLVLALGCATTEKYERKLATWVGKDVNDLMVSWGTPSETYTMPNGYKQYTYSRQGSTVATSSYNPLLQQSTAIANTRWCKTTFTANEVGTIQAWRWEGNSCESSD